MLGFKGESISDPARCGQLDIFSPLFCFDPLALRALRLPACLAIRRCQTLHGAIGMHGFQGLIHCFDVGIRYCGVAGYE